ncbi:hypothetical protein HN784_01395 [bacterium]|jgi:hypothetical protein|nr:hypothetical protein [bacterium]MBT4250921.1 hypothetical protein [bacterium]MBT4597891.1 hypothetical protein [bacterium]MBT6753917.1 hypothetical protein [bacterium]MBT7037346.1 hypothetical protein [bacterium]
MQSFYIVLIGLFTLFSADSAQAYLDPGTGSFIFQLAIGAILGGIVALKLRFKQVKNFGLSLFKGKKVESKENLKKS